MCNVKVLNTFSKWFVLSNLDMPTSALYIILEQHGPEFTLSPQKQGTADDVVKSTTKYIPAVLFDKRKYISSVTYSINLKN